MSLAEMLGSNHEDARSSECGPDDSCLEGLETLESDVKQMAQQIREYRRTLPDRLKNTLASVLTAQRPLVPELPDSKSSEAPNSGASEQDVLIGEKSFVLEDPETAQKVQLLKEKISSNASAMPLVLQRMKDCIAKIEKLNSYNVIIHPAFKRKQRTFQHWPTWICSMKPCVQILKKRKMVDDLPPLLDLESFPYTDDGGVRR